MSKTFRDLYVFGDSYSTTDYCVPWRESFWGLAAQHLAIDRILNYSALGNSLDTLIYLLQVEQQNINFGPDSLVMVCVPALERITWHDMSQDSLYQYQDITLAGEISNVPVDSHRNLRCDPLYQVVPEMAKVLERSWTETQGLSKLFFLFHYLEKLGTPFMIMNMCFNYPRQGWPTNFFQDWFDTKDNVILFENTYASINVDVNRPVDYDLYRWQGHHGSEGNKRFFELGLKPKLENYVKRLRS